MRRGEKRRGGDRRSRERRREKRRGGEERRGEDRRGQERRVEDYQPILSENIFSKKWTIKGLIQMNISWKYSLLENSEALYYKNC